ncbi:MAG: DNA adenine methylase [Holophagaceae bacterium]|nr:DNA adenine methylase [Holophagaceae bacterium]
MDYLTAKEVASKWGITPRRVALLCSENRIDGAELIDKMWVIPRAAQKPGDRCTTRFESPADMPVKPFLKWVGGKSQILEDIRRKYPSGLGTTITKYAEPFVGGGAVLFDVLSRYKMKDVYISDINRELIQTYIVIRDNVTELIAYLKDIEQKYLSASDSVRKEIYYSERDRFNVLKLVGNESVEIATLFIFLNKTCFNGLYRVNSSGAFNVPQGSYKQPTICDERNLIAVSEKLHGALIVCADYQESRSFIDSNTFVYFDPPYRPLTATASFTSFAKNGFGDKEQAELATFVTEISGYGANIIASNSDPKNADGNDDFFDRLYAQNEIIRIYASRAINSIGSSRGKVSELLICNTSRRTL